MSCEGHMPHSSGKPGIVLLDGAFCFRTWFPFLVAALPWLGTWNAPSEAQHLGPVVISMTIGKVFILCIHHELQIERACCPIDSKAVVINRKDEIERGVGQSSMHNGKQFNIAVATRSINYCLFNSGSILRATV